MIKQYVLREGTKYEVLITRIACGKDMVVAISGGTERHVGAVSLAMYEPSRKSATVSTICAYTHRDDVVAAKVAKILATECKCTVTVSVGIHIDDATVLEIQKLVDMCIDCCSKIKADYKK